MKKLDLDKERLIQLKVDGRTITCQNTLLKEFILEHIKNSVRLP